MSDYGSDDYLVQFISGLAADGTVAATSFATWNGSGDPTQSSSYASVSDVRKWGGGAAGTPATISYAFDAGSHWTTTEQNGFVAAMHLWQAEAGVTFVAAGDAASAGIVFTRTSDGQAEGSTEGTRAAVGSARVGTIYHGEVDIDTSVSGFGPVGQGLSYRGGYPWMTAEHEIGHALGLGHPGGYNGDGDLHQNGSDDNRAMSIMSYFTPSYAWGRHDGVADVPVTPMALDIGAMQRLYGMPVNSPLSGGDVFGFNSNIQGDIHQFFDFSVNTNPIVTLWSSGGGNTLDLTGFAAASSGTLRAGLGSGYGISAGGLDHNISIAPDTHIDTLLLGAGNDTISGNDDSDVIVGGAGADTLAGGAGNDHLYGGATAQSAGDGADMLNGGGGNDYIQGNAGADTIDGGMGDDRLYGGADNDHISGSAGNDIINGNRGADLIDGGDGNDFLRGGQDNDTISGGGGNDTISGDNGNDRISGGGGVDVLAGGEGSDLFVFTDRDAQYSTQGPDTYRLDEIVDYLSGTDHLHLDMGIPSHILDLGAQGSVQAAAAVATPLLSGADNAGANFTELAKVSVGSDTVLFFWGAAVGMEGVKIDGFNPASLSAADFV